MATQAERLSVVETKVENLVEKVETLREQTKENSEILKEQLDKMYEASCTQHAELAKKISGLEKVRDKITWMVAGGVALAGILFGHLDKIVAFLN